MEGTKERTTQVVLSHPGRNTNVAQRESSGKGMVRQVFATALEVVPKTGHGLQPKGELLRLRIVTPQKAVIFEILNL
jgi:hypothetical protein